MALPVPGILKLCNYLQNVVAITYIFGLQLSTFLFYNKQVMIDNAGCLEDLRVPPANQLELLKGDRAGQYSIRINGQYRICFNVNGNNFYNVEIVDYH